MQINQQQIVIIMNMSGQIEISDCVFVDYELSDCGGKIHCDKAQLNCTFDNVDQVADMMDELSELGIDDNTSLIMFVNQKLDLT